MTLGLSTIAGQVLGGWMVHADLFGLGWRSIFLINVPIGMFAIAAVRCIPETRAPQRAALVGMGIALSSTGLTLLLVALIEGPAQGWPGWSLWSLSMAIALFALFYQQQERRRVRGGIPLVDMQLLSQRRFALGAVLVLLVYSTSSSFFLCFALLMQTGLGLDPLVAGSIFAPCSLGFMLASLAAPRLAARFGMHAIVVGTLVYMLSIAEMIVQVRMAGAALVAVRLMPVLIMVGVGQGFIMTPLLNVVLGFVDKTQAGMASGVVSTVQQVGAALGVAVVGILFGEVLTTGGGTVVQAGQYADAFVAGMFYNLGAAMLVCVLLLLLAKTR